MFIIQSLSVRTSVGSICRSLCPKPSRTRGWLHGLRGNPVVPSPRAAGRWHPVWTACGRVGFGLRVCRAAKRESTLAREVGRWSALSHPKNSWYTEIKWCLKQMMYMKVPLHKLTCIFCRSRINCKWVALNDIQVVPLVLKKVMVLLKWWHVVTFYLYQNAASSVWTLHFPMLQLWQFLYWSFSPLTSIKMDDMFSHPYMTHLSHSWVQVQRLLYSMKQIKPKFMRKTSTWIYSSLKWLNREKSFGQVIWVCRWTRHMSFEPFNVLSSRIYDTYCRAPLEGDQNILLLTSHKHSWGYIQLVVGLFTNKTYYPVWKQAKICLS